MITKTIQNQSANVLEGVPGRIPKTKCRHRGIAIANIMNSVAIVGLQYSQVCTVERALLPWASQAQASFIIKYPARYRTDNREFEPRRNGSAT